MKHAIKNRLLLSTSEPVAIANIPSLSSPPHPIYLPTHSSSLNSLSLFFLYTDSVDKALLTRQYDDISSYRAAENNFKHNSTSVRWKWPRRTSRPGPKIQEAEGWAQSRRYFILREPLSIQRRSGANASTKDDLALLIYSHSNRPGTRFLNVCGSPSFFSPCDNSESLSLWRIGNQWVRR